MPWNHPTRKSDPLSLQASQLEIATFSTSTIIKTQKRRQSTRRRWRTRRLHPQNQDPNPLTRLLILSPELLKKLPRSPPPHPKPSNPPRTTRPLPLPTNQNPRRPTPPRNSNHPATVLKPLPPRRRLHQLHGNDPPAWKIAVRDRILESRARGEGGDSKRIPGGFEVGLLFVPSSNQYRSKRDNRKPRTPFI